MAAGSPSEVVQYGSQMKALFPFKSGFRNLNHGSFGACPTAIVEAQARYQALANATPDPFIRYTYAGMLLKSRQAVADLVHAPLKSTVLVENATTGVNIALWNLFLGYQDGRPPGRPDGGRDVAIVFSSIYAGCGRTVKAISEATGIGFSTIKLTYPTLEDDKLIEHFRASVAEIKQRGDIPRVAVFDTISSLPGVRMPFEKLIKVCKELGVLSMVDGAHGIGMIDLDLPDLDPDFFTSNLHKWLMVPRVCALMYVPERNQELIRTSLPTSHGFLSREDVQQQTPSGRYMSDTTGYEQSRFELLFESIGTLDLSSYLCVADTLTWRQIVGGGETKIHHYCNTLAANGSQKMAEILGTEVMENAAGTLGKDHALRMVRLPVAPEAASVAMIEVPRLLIDKYNTYAPTWGQNGTVWVRVSSQVYLDENDFVYLGQALKEVCDSLRA